eukprot:scaffold8772_cov112-Skeletonema_marinoi.AAC.1
MGSSDAMIPLWMSKRTINSNNNNAKTAKKGVAGRIDYDSWEKRASNLSKELDEEDEQEKEAAASALGLDGKHARSQAEAEEKSKAEEMQKAKQRLEAYQKREQGVTETLSGLLGPVVDDDTTAK